MKKFVSMALSALLILFLAACGNSAGTQSAASESSTSSESVSSAAEESEASSEAPTEEPTATPEPTEAPSDKPTIEETVLLDSDNVKVTATGLGDTYLNITVENNTDKDIYVQTADSSICVNGYVLNGICVASAAAGETVDSTIEFTKYDLEEIGIETITEFEVALNVVDSTDWSNICSSDPVVLQTSAYGTVETAAPEGEVLYDEGGVKLVMLGTREYEGDSFYFPTRVKFYIENNSENAITADPLDLNVNGQLTQGGFGISTSMSGIPAGKRTVTELHFDADACKTNGITELKDVSFTFSIKDAKSWDNIAQSDTISLTF